MTVFELLVELFDYDTASAIERGLPGRKASYLRFELLAEYDAEQRPVMIVDADVQWAMDGRIILKSGGPEF